MMTLRDFPNHDLHAFAHALVGIWEVRVLAVSGKRAFCFAK